MSEKIILRSSTYDKLADSMAHADGLPPYRQGQPQRRPMPAQTPENWIKITSTTTSTVTVSGGTISAYPAVWSYFDTGTAAWVDTSNVAWWYGANGETPTNGSRYLSRCVGLDTSGVPIWSAEISSGGGGGSLALLDKTGSTVDAACVSLKMDAAGVLTVANLSTGHDQFSVTYASPTQAGVVGTSTQAFGGDKTFIGNVSVQDTSSGASYIGVFQYQYQFPNGSGHYFPTVHGNRSTDSPTLIALVMDSLNNRLGVVASKISISTDGGGSVNDGLTTSIGYNKSGGGTGTLTFTGGILTGST